MWIFIKIPKHHDYIISFLEVCFFLKITEESFINLIFLDQWLFPILWWRAAVDWKCNKSLRSVAASSSPCFALVVPVSAWQAWPEHQNNVIPLSLPHLPCILQVLCGGCCILYSLAVKTRLASSPGGQSSLHKVGRTWLLASPALGRRLSQLTVREAGISTSLG